MSFFAGFWGALLILATAGFALLSVIIMIKGAAELKDIFRRLGRGR